MSSLAKALEPAFQGAGQRLGTEIWRIENFQPVPLPKSDNGKFYSGDSYIVLQTSPGKGGVYLYDIHVWLGKDTSQDEARTAAIETVELDGILGGRAVQHRELQGLESDKFLSYFKPCIIPLERSVASGFKKPEEEEFETRLYVCKGKRVVRLKQVPFSRSSLNHDDVFILDRQDKIFQFNGANSNIQERAKSLEVIQFLKDKYHEGKSDVAIIDGRNLVTESDSSEFWVIFGGFAPISKKVASKDDVIPEKTPPKLHSITDGQVKPADGELSKSLFENNKCYLLDCGAEVFVWFGRVTQVGDRKAATQAAEEFLNSDNRPKSTRVTRMIQGYETRAFKSNFDSWPSGAVPSIGEEGRGKVAALLKQQGVGVEGTAKGAPVNEQVPPLLEGGGKIEVWCIDGSAKTPVPMEDIGKFCSGDCYIVLYTYRSGNKSEGYYLCCWIGKDSIEEDQKMAACLATNMFNSLKGRPVQGCIFQGKEPPQFIAIFQPMVVLKGGMSSGYKTFIANKGLNDETYAADCALIRISGTSVHNNKAVQVDAVATSLNSNECFLLQSGSSIFTWHGNQSTFEQQQLVSKVAEFLKPGVAVKFVEEGTENSFFWSALGGKKCYTSKKEAQEIVRDPHLFTFSFSKEGKFEVEEVYNFSQDDLLTEDVLILDTHAEVFVWVGQSAESKEKQIAFEIGQKHIHVAALLEGLSPHVPLYIVTEGNEPCFFTLYFSWDSAKATAPGNSFQKKAMLLLGAGHAVESLDKSNGSSQSGPTQRASALAALSSAFNPSSGSKSDGTPRSSGTSQGSQRAAALSQVLTAEKKQSLESSPAQSTRSPPSEAGTNSENALSEVENSKEDSKVNDLADETVLESNGNDSGGFPIEVVLPQEFESLQNSVFQIIKASTAIITDTRHVILKLHGFKALKNLLRKKKVSGLAIKSPWIEIEDEKVRIIIYPKGDNKARSHISFFIQKQKKLDPFHGTFYISYALSIGDRQRKLKCAKGRFVDNEAEMGWSEYVDLGEVMEREAGLLVDNSIAFNADMWILKEVFCVGSKDIRSVGIPIGESVKSLPVLWGMYNLAFFFDILSTEGIVSPSFQFEKFVIQMVLFIENEYVGVRLNCDGASLDDSDKNCPIFCTMKLLVSSEKGKNVYKQSCSLRPKVQNEVATVIVKASKFPREGQISFRFDLLRGNPVEEFSKESAQCYKDDKFEPSLQNVDPNPNVHQLHAEADNIKVSEENARCYEDDKFETILQNADLNPNEHQLHVEADNIVSDVCESKEERQAKFADMDGEKASWKSQRELDREHFAGENKHLHERLNEAESQLRKFHSLQEEFEKLSKKNKHNEHDIAILETEKSETDNKLQKAERLNETISEKFKAEIASWKSLRELDREHFAGENKHLHERLNEAESQLRKFHSLQEEFEKLTKKNKHNEHDIAILETEKSETDNQLQKAERLNVTISEKFKAEKSVGKLKEKEAEQLRKKVGELEKELECTIQKNTELIDEKNAISCTCKKAEDLTVTISEKLKAEKSVGKLKEEAEQLHKKVGELEKELECMIQKNTELKDEKNAISSTCERLQRKLEADTRFYLLLLDSLKDARAALLRYIQILHAARETLEQRVQRLENDLLTLAVDD